MILPTKHISARDALLSVGALVIRRLDRPCTPTELWERVRGLPEIGGWGRFVLTLDMLHIMGTVEFQADGLLVRSEQL
jgi:hypothetical protein